MLSGVIIGTQPSLHTAYSPSRARTQRSVSLAPSAGSAPRSPWTFRVLLLALLFVGGCTLLTVTTGTAHADLAADVGAPVAGRGGQEQPPGPPPVTSPQLPAPEPSAIDADEHPETTQPDALLPAAPAAGAAQPGAAQPEVAALPATVPVTPAPKTAAPAATPVPATLPPTALPPAAAPTGSAPTHVAPTVNACPAACPAAAVYPEAADRARPALSADTADRRLYASPAVRDSGPAPVATPRQPEKPLLPTPAPVPPVSPLAPAPSAPPAPVAGSSASVGSTPQGDGPGSEFAVLRDASVVSLSRGSIGTSSGPRNHVVGEIGRFGDRPD